LKVCTLSQDKKQLGDFKGRKHSFEIVLKPSFEANKECSLFGRPEFGFLSTLHPENQSDFVHVG
jgi:hypothetical protein